MRKRKVTSSKLQRGDVFTLEKPPSDVVGEVFWKHPKTGCIRRMRQREGQLVFGNIDDLATMVFLQGAFKRAQVTVISKFEPTSKDESFQLPR